MNDLGRLLSVDPSIVSPGVSLFSNGILVASACLKIKPVKEACEMLRVIYAADAIVQWVQQMGGNIDSVCYEWPQIYDHDTPAKANSVIYMAGVDGAITSVLMLAAVMRQVNLEINSFVPRDVWGQLPKSKTGSYWMCPRGRRVKSRLSDAEFAVAGDQHDQGDSIGIGLHKLGRLGIHHAFSSGND